MTNLIVAKRYARALLDLGKEDGNFEKYGSELAEFIELLDASSELESVFNNPGLGFDDRRKLLDTFLEKMGLSPFVNNFFRLLMDRGRIDAVRDINAVYEGLIDEVNGITRAEITSASALKPEDVDRIKAALATKAGAEVTLKVQEDPSLIGGVVARIGDLVLDGSVKAQLETLKDSLRRGEYA